MAQYHKHYEQDLTQDLKIRREGTLVFASDADSVVITVDILNNGEYETLSGTAAGAVIRPDGSTVPVTTAAVSGHSVTMTLTGACFSIPGDIGVGIQIISGGMKTTILKAIYNVELFETPNVIDPAGTITLTVGDLVDDIADAVATIPADYSDLMGAVAPTFSTGTAYAAGQYVWYDGDLYCFTAAHSAGAWNSAHVTSAVIGNDVSNLKTAFGNLNVSNALAIFEQGGLRANNGTTVGSNAVIRTAGYVNSACLEVIANSGYKFCVFYYNLDGTYYGCVQTDGTIAAVSNTKWFTTSYGLNNKNYKYKIAVKRTDDGNLTTAEYTGVGFVFSTDKALTGEWKAADSKTVGDRFSADEALLAEKIDADGFAYGEGTRTFTDKLLTCPDSNVITTSSNNSYATYEYQVSGAASFKVTGATRGASNYLAIGADSQGNVLQLVEQGTASVTTPYTNYEFTINTAGVTVVYICLYKTQSITPSVEIAIPTTEYDKQQDADITEAKTLGNRWVGKKIVTFGDSRTWYDGETYGDTTKSPWTGETCVGYQQTMANLLGATIINQGFNGYTSAQICTEIRSYDFTGVDAVFLEGGANDFVKSSQVTIGEIAPIGSTFDTTTVYGAWQSAVEYILTNYPSCLIYMDIPAIAWLGSGDTVFPYDTAKIKGEIAALYNLPCLDLYKDGGINIINRDYWYVDDPSETNNWRLHFNDYGNALIGAKIAQFINEH